MTWIYNEERDIYEYGANVTRLIDRMHMETFKESSEFEDALLEKKKYAKSWPPRKEVKDVQEDPTDWRHTIAIPPSS